MRIRWTPPALAQIAEIHQYIATENPQAARRVVAQIRKDAILLSAQPSMGRAGRVPGTRELVVSRYPFIIAYRIDGNDIPILAVIHSARRWPEQLPE
ncbi:type II toxin-antitoxin system RelE/ParE family toxin [Sulfuritalea sp.]|uniref:type II toxin-antitoxin system RelE/ParE family toxin n=1 Tax=Sulfuritalea sp. TaxID=2480090 RepID=UPI00286E9FCA|nr:type II toxin-antitoxin system RelE/ParE family toxin [Sulfuritalea sp.]